MSETREDRARILADSSHDPIDRSAQFVVTGKSTEHLEAAIAMAMARFRRVSHCRTSPSEINFYSFGQPADAVKLPFDLDVIGVIDISKSFLRSQVTRPPQPDHDGSNSAGWRVSIARYGQELHVAFHWLEHHK